MTRINHFSVLLFILLSINVTAQTKEQVSSNVSIMKRIMADHDRYSFASASASTFDEAVNHAVQFLAGQISTNIKVETDHTLKSERKDLQLLETEVFNQVSNTFTNVSLNDYHTLLVEMPRKKKNEYTAFVYISNLRVEQIIKEIRQKEEKEVAKRTSILTNDIQFYYNEGLISLQDLRVGDALKYFYWGAALSSNTDITIKTRSDETMLASSLLESLLDKTLSNIVVQAGTMEKNDINGFQSIYSLQLSFFYNFDNTLKKITNLDYVFNDGNSYLAGARVRDGISMIELSYPLDMIQICCVYNYDKSETPEAVYEKINHVTIRNFQSAYKSITISQKAIATTKVTPKHAEQKRGNNDEEETMDQEEDYAMDDDSIFFHDHEAMESVMDEIVAAIYQKKYNSVKSSFTEEGYDSFCKLVEYGDASIIGNPNLEFVDFDSITICKSIPMLFKFKHNKKFVENVVFRFNASGLIESLAFALSEVAQHSILDDPDFTQDSKLTILSFMEDYQTAYALGRIEYLESIFSENALIITGCKVFKKEQSDDIRIKGYTKYNTISKSDYIERLKTHFLTKEYINLNFTETEFKQSFNAKDFFGIRVRQEYFSSNYGDVGYLYLIVDLRGDLPIIHVRAWQEDKINPDSLFSLKDVY